MCEKKWYKLVFEQLQPIHIGTKGYGVISETRIFIPGWTMWGALTKFYNLYYNKGNFSENEKLFENISCFYPSFEKNGDKPLLPRWEQGEFFLGDYREEFFRAMFVDTFVSTAIVPLTRGAKDESLHEIDIVLPKSKEAFHQESRENLYWVGLLKIDEQTKGKLSNNKQFKLTIGGDSRYGLGEMMLINIEEESIENDLNFLFANFLSVSNGPVESTIEHIIEIQRIENKNFSVKSKGLYYHPGYKMKKEEKEEEKIKKYVDKLSKGCIEKL